MQQSELVELSRPRVPPLTPTDLQRKKYQAERQIRNATETETRRTYEFNEANAYKQLETTIKQAVDTYQQTLKTVSTGLVSRMKGHLYARVGPARIEQNLAELEAFLRDNPGATGDDLARLRAAQDEVEFVPQVRSEGCVTSDAYLGSKGILQVQYNYADDNFRRTPDQSKYSNETLNAFYARKNRDIADHVLAQHRSGQAINLTLQEMPPERAQQLAKELSRKLGTRISWVQSEHSVVMTTGRIVESNAIVVVGGIGRRSDGTLKYHSRTAVNAAIEFGKPGAHYSVGVTSSHLALSDDNRRVESNAAIQRTVSKWAENSPEIPQISTGDYNDGGAPVRLLNGDHLDVKGLDDGNVADEVEFDRLELVEGSLVVSATGQDSSYMVAEEDDGRRQLDYSDHKMVIVSFQPPK